MLTEHKGEEHKVQKHKEEHKYRNTKERKFYPNTPSILVSVRTISTRNIFPAKVRNFNVYGNM